MAATSFVAAADYFQDRADNAGKSLGVAKSKCFSGLSAYSDSSKAAWMRHPGNAALLLPRTRRGRRRGWAACLHGQACRRRCSRDCTIGAAGKSASAKKRVFFIDYQVPTDPFDLEVCKRIREGGLGKLRWYFRLA